MTNSSIQQEVESISEQQAAWQMLEAMLPTSNLTAEADAGMLMPAVVSKKEVFPEQSEQEGQQETVEQKGASDPVDCYEVMSKILYRRENHHLLVSGMKGVGKTAMVKELARRAATGEIPFLREKIFLWIDCNNVGPEDSRACLETILTSVSGLENNHQKPKIILCLDGIGELLKRNQGGTNKPLLKAAAARSGLQIIGILSDWEFNDLIGSDAAMLELFTRFEVEEPNEETTREIACQSARQYEQDYNITIENDVVTRVVALTDNFILNEQQPAKSIKVLRQLFESRDYQRSQQGIQQANITLSDVVRTMAELTGIPQETLAGEADQVDFGAALSHAVIGQQQAVDVVSNEMRLIKAGLTETGQPATVMLFAGMTGVGKTELAKRVAELYSTSKKINTYTMGNYSEPHSVSGIIGVPPGYVGHEHGGRLINDLNADPYAVFLLDEAEKAHPNVWKPFLNLFDEGWIVDQRGVKAYADRAIFILTTNAGDNAIAQMTKSGKSEAEIVERVTAILARYKHERSSQAVFTTQLLARIKRIMVFNMLDEAALTGICRKQISQMQKMWLQKREKQVEVSEELIEWIGRHAHSQNEKSGGKEGGRLVRKLISDFIESQIQQQATKHSTEYKSCHQIKVSIVVDNIPEIQTNKSDHSEEILSLPQIKVAFSK